MKTTIKFSLLSLTVLALATLPLTAAEKADKAETKKEEKASPSKAERTGLILPFHGTLKSKTDASFTIQFRTKDLTIEVTSETKIVKNGKPATLAEAVVGEDVGGQYHSHEGKMIAKSVRFGTKPEVEKTKKPEAKTETKPEVKPAAKADAVAPATK